MRKTMACMSAYAVLQTPVLALVSFNDGKDRIHVTGAVNWSWDSNIYANSDGDGDYIMGASLTSEYSRRAGVLGVDASLAVNAARFNRFSTEDFANPTAQLELTKSTGRTTGSALIRAQRESKADTAANIRNESWNYAAALNAKYPVIERYSLNAGVNAGRRDFQDNETLVDLDTIGGNLDLAYTINSERDLLAGVRHRHERTSVDTVNVDNAFTLGISGKILPKLNGSLRAGWQERRSDGQFRDETFKSWTAGMSATWLISKRLTSTAQLSKDFSTTSTNISTDTLAFSLDTNFIKSARWTYSLNLGYGTSDFLGLLGEGRTDEHFTFQLSASYTLNQHLKVSAGYVYFVNNSSLPFADYTRNGFSLSVTSRW